MKQSKNRINLTQTLINNSLSNISEIKYQELSQKVQALQFNEERWLVWNAFESDIMPIHKFAANLKAASSSLQMYKHQGGVKQDVQHMYRYPCRSKHPAQQLLVGVATKQGVHAVQNQGIFVWDMMDSKNERVMLYQTAGIISELSISHVEGTNSTEITFIEDQLE